MSRRGIELSDQDWRWVKTLAAATGTTIAGVISRLIQENKAARARSSGAKDVTPRETE